MKARIIEKNGKARLCLEDRKKRDLIKMLLVFFSSVAIILVSIVSGSYSSQKEDLFNSSCKIEIPGIPKFKFCQAWDDHGIYFYNDEMFIRIR